MYGILWDQTVVRNCLGLKRVNLGERRFSRWFCDSAHALGAALPFEAYLEHYLYLFNSRLCNG